ncbi:cysteine desulfurase NifS [Flavonifractor sp. DFI.6.63]|uniref:Cysteine desulfurase IscS n=1 Tax=Lawsonibacter hominis TaxID=2763053 RepID=A0A8J6M5W2_9FIRM|nr:MULTISPECIES: cysteine desulfurase NifS [Oscillospiraceae]MBS1385265.1 cysteine desulfurase NifS [Flavonifractor sp.]MDU2195394.1 cysteine desulfurase NifS [Clostridiales bacterium]MBC5734222.1 cysteine desulfurase NifS [Lawsonibacter hominis]MCI6399445.1 cysteine desulfurase NifS [Lawsonibacter sp.]MCQ5030676.1 cysteine desulfurase NifS [Flavonifractor sp. DFI.6.63]
MSRIVYADHAATTALSDTALKAMLPYFNQSYGNPSSLYSFAQQAKSDLEAARAQVAACLNAQPEEIYFTSCGSESDNWALRGVAEQKKDKGRHIITSAIEHHAILHTARYLEKQGFEVTYLPVDGQGRVDPAAVKAALRPDTILISIMTANNEIGTIEPIAEIGAIAREAGVLFHTDAVQAVGHIPVDVQAWKVDLLSLSGHKFRGPRGMGALYVRKGVRLPPLMFGGGQEKGRRAGTENVAGAVGLAAALREATDGLAAESARLSALRDKLAAGLGRIPYSRLTGDPVNRLPGTASFVFEGVEGEALLLLLDARGICASSGSACSSASLDPSHVLLAIGLPHAIAHGSLRLTLGAENTEEDVAYLLQEVPRVVQYLREMSPVWDKAAGKPTWEL